LAFVPLEPVEAFDTDIPVTAEPELTVVLLPAGYA
jgi:hypothetical protein